MLTAMDFKMKLANTHLYGNSWRSHRVWRPVFDVDNIDFGNLDVATFFGRKYKADTDVTFQTSCSENVLLNFSKAGDRIASAQKA